MAYVLRPFKDFTVAGQWQCRAGVRPGKFPFVEMTNCAAVHLSPVGVQSCWNCDGEILPDTEVTMKIHQGLADVFAREFE